MLLCAASFQTAKHSICGRGSGEEHKVTEQPESSSCIFGGLLILILDHFVNHLLLGSPIESAGHTAAVDEFGDFERLHVTLSFGLTHQDGFRDIGEVHV